MSVALPAVSRLSLHDAVVADGFTPLAVALRDELIAFPRYKPMRIGHAQNESFQTCITTGHIQGRFPELTTCHRFVRFLHERAAEISALVGADPAPPHGVDMSAMVYGQGGLLRVHTDSVLTRKLAFILYLTPPEDGEWTPADGGELVLSDRRGTEVTVFPRFNRFVAFRVTDGAWHEVREVRRATTWPRARFALAGWIDGRLHPML